MGGSHGLVVMGGDSCSQGCEFESRHHFTGWTFFTFNCCQKLSFVFEKMKINEKETGVGPFKKTR